MQTYLTRDKKFYVIASICAAFSLQCGMLNFDLEHDIPEQRVQAIDLFDPQNDSQAFFFAPMALNLNIEQEMQARDAGPADKVILKSFQGLWFNSFLFHKMDSSDITIACFYTAVQHDSFPKLYRLTNRETLLFYFGIFVSKKENVQ